MYRPAIDAATNERECNARDEGVRGAVMWSILDDLSSSGDVIHIARSLGSVIGIDFLDHLPQQVGGRFQTAPREAGQRSHPDGGR